MNSLICNYIYHIYIYIYILEFLYKSTQEYNKTGNITIEVMPFIKLDIGDGYIYKLIRGFQLISIR